MGTECRGTSDGAALPIKAETRTARSEAWTAQPRLRIRCYNVGGVTSEVYDHLQQWLLQKCQDDIVILQELHWGCGKHESQWRIPGWNFYVTADAQHRHSGVAVIISERVARGDEISFCTWIPGRQLHVRCAGPRLTLDVIAGYQWVRHTHSDAKQEELRGSFLHKMGALLHGIPARNMVVIGADWNTHCHPVAGHVGRGVLRTSHVRDVDLEAFLQEHDLVFLNSWGSARARCCHTFVHGDAKSQIDFVALRRPTADALSRRAKPEVFDLAPWRRGAKHHAAVVASVPWRAGWTFDKRATVTERFSLSCLRQSLQSMDAPAQELRTVVEKVLTQAHERGSTLAEANAQVLQHCRRIYPRTRKSVEGHPKPSNAPKVIHAAEQMWVARDAKRQAVPARSFKGIAETYRRAEAFKQASKALRTASRAARKAWFEEQIRTAETPARKHDLGGVYRVINAIAPKKRREQVRIRGARGQLLGPQAEFDEIFQHFQGVFDSTVAFDMPTRGQVEFGEPEVLSAIQGLKGGKALPDTSVPSELWQLCPGAYARFFSSIISARPQERESLPPEVTDCTLALIPKPNKPSRRPADLRPLGLQDPGSKVLAMMVRGRLQEITMGYLLARPQYAYCPTKAIDDAICRVARHCRAVRDRVRSSVLSVHDRRAGRTTSHCVGGVMMSIDLSRAFDNVPRWALQMALDKAGASTDLQQVVLALHEKCRYQVKHKGYEGTFAMKKGVRQGCALSPYL